MTLQLHSWAFVPEAVKCMPTQQAQWIFTIASFVVPKNESALMPFGK